MKKELEKQLVRNYPRLFKYYRQDQATPLYYGVECGDGWYDLIDKALDTIQKEIDAYPESEKDRFVLYQIKEKFGSLRIYMSDEVGYMKNAINDAYKESLKTCVRCGSDKEVTQNTENFVRSMCPDCMKIYAQDGYKLLNGEF